MKKIIFSIAFLVSCFAVAGEPTYTLSHLCSFYAQSCLGMPFCEVMTIPAQVPGCHAKPEYAYLEGGCVINAPELCTASGACYISNVSSPAHRICVARPQ